jgi:hypothetical protein
MMQVLISSARLQLTPFKMADAGEVFECITPATARFILSCGLSSSHDVL